MEQKSAKLNLYSIFHLNIAYSSIPEEERETVIKRCYWPLLLLAERFPGAITIEASGYTLEQIQKLDPEWVSLLRNLWERKILEFIGSGYAQLIGPLVPARVNEENLKIGNQVYELLLGTRPLWALVNEQAYSRSLVEHYKKAGYEAIVTEWNNPRLSHPEWADEFQYYSHHVLGTEKNTLGLLWTNSIAFQKFQRYVHNEIDLDEYLDYIRAQKGGVVRAFPLYGSDVEIFDFRPGRYKTEAPLGVASEWKRIEDLFSALHLSPDFSFIFPSGVRKIESPHAFKCLSLETADQPVPVKKQMKYNITRWALTGRDNMKINSKCYRIFNNLCAGEKNLAEKEQRESRWKELCYLWGSDFRTHIEERRYKNFLNQLEDACQNSHTLVGREITNPKEPLSLERGEGKLWRKEKGRVIIETSSARAVFNLRMGLALESLIFPAVSPLPVMGTVPHGYYDDITLGDDFMSGHTSIDIPMRPEMTDLGRIVNPRVRTTSEYVEISGDVAIPAGTIRKTARVSRHEPMIDYLFSFDLKGVSPSSFRSGIFTFIPDSFDRNTLYYGCHNGGVAIEEFSLAEIQSISPTSVSSLVSSRTALGNTQGTFVVGDKDKRLMLKTDMSKVAGLPMLQWSGMPREQTFLLRVLYSLGEFNETSFLAEQRAGRKFSFAVSVEGMKI